MLQNGTGLVLGLGSCRFLLLLDIVDVALTEVKCVADELLTVEAGHHSVHEGFFIAEELT